MIKTSFYKVFYIFFISLFILSCNKESFIENVGASTTVGNDPANNKGSFTFWTSSTRVLFCSNGLTVSIDGVVKGTIKEMSLSEPNCGANGTKAFSITLPVGSYLYLVKGSGVGCSFKYEGNFTIKKGGCTSLELM